MSSASKQNNTGPLDGPVISIGYVKISIIFKTMMFFSRGWVTKGHRAFEIFAPVVYPNVEQPGREE